MSAIDLFIAEVFQLVSKILPWFDWKMSKNKMFSRGWGSVSTYGVGQLLSLTRAKYGVSVNLNQKLGPSQWDPHTIRYNGPMWQATSALRVIIERNANDWSERENRIAVVIISRKYFNFTKIPLICFALIYIHTWKCGNPKPNESIDLFCVISKLVYPYNWEKPGIWI